MSNTSYPALLATGLNIYQAATFDVTYTYLEDDETTPIDLSDVTEAYLVIRKDVKSSDSVISITTSANSNGSKIYLGGSLGTVRVYIDNNDTKDFPEITGAFDLFLMYSDGVVEGFMYGPVYIKRRVSLR